MVVAVVGVGLIGGSIGMAARERLGARVTGFDPDPAVLEAALVRGAIDEASASPELAVGSADLVFVAAPVGRLGRAIEEVLSYAPEDCAVTDVGSTKRRIVAGANDRRFVGGHPLAGAETSGVEHARADLFEGATWYLTPHASTTGVLYERLHRAIAGIGAQPTAIDPEIHDRVMATVSHLPHVLANVLVAQASRALVDPGSPGEAERVPATGPSFRDATRVAGANGAIWTDIYLSNRDALISALDGTIARLGEIRAALASADRGAIDSWNDAARGDRDALLGAGLAGGTVHELRVAVPNRPGVVAEIALTLGRAGVNIVDMALSPSQTDGQGVVALWFRGEEQADRAARLIAGLSMPVARA
ncbi:MAG TPA: prephenate dehydrogenase/arogenate dehydrogenase family protein [Solirubrobacteraceae bacterium]|nr:prephenate dehydrogenase/arogenate dehydrogenase family protein [Solirubrobacteraceae bacterium]